MGFSLDDPNLDLATVADGKAVVKGRFNERKASLLIRRVGKTNFSNNVIKDFENNMIHQNVAVYLGVDLAPGTDFIAYAFESSGFSFNDFKQGEKRYADAKEAFSQILKAVKFLHSKGFGIKNLDRRTSFLLSEVGSSITVKIMPYNCYRLGADALEQKKSNVRSFGKLLTSFFFGDKVDISYAAAYDVVRNFPPIRNVPCFKDGAVRLRPYTCEISHAIKCANDPQDCEEPAACLEHIPFRWTSEERLGFYHDSWENISDFDIGHSVISDIDNMKGFSQIHGSRSWINFCPELIADLRFYQPLFRPSRLFGGLASSNGGCSTSKGYGVQDSAAVGGVLKKQKLGSKSGDSSNFQGCYGQESSAVRGYHGVHESSVAAGLQLRSVIVGPSTSIGSEGQEGSAIGVKLKSVVVDSRSPKGTGGQETLGVGSIPEGTGAQEALADGVVVIEKKKKFIPVRGTPCDFLRCLRNVKVHCFRSRFYRGLSGAEVYKKFDYDSDVESGLDALISVLLPHFLLGVHDALVKSLQEDRKAGLPVDESLDKYLKYAYIPKNP